MPYYIQLEKIQLSEYKNKLKNAYLIPSREILKENIEERFEYFMKIGISNILELQKLLKNKNKFAELLKNECFSEEYLKVLLREINSIQPKPNKINDFKNISENTFLKLEKAGIKDTLKLFDFVKTSDERNKLANKLNIDISEILTLTKLTDLSRIKWVGATFAYVLFMSGFDNVEKISNANYEELYNKIRELNSEKQLYKGQIGLNDMKLLVHEAKELFPEIEY